MKIEDFDRINQSLGHTIKKVGDYYFSSQRDTSFPFPVYNAFPLNKRVCVDRKLARALKWKFLITQVLLDPPNNDIHEYLLTTSNYDIEQFSKNARKSIRRSLKTFNFQRPSIEDLLNEGYVINKQTCLRQSRSDERMMDFNKWSEFVKSIYNSSGYTILGAYREGKMAGYLVVYELEGMFNTAGAFINRNYAVGASPMKGLLYSMMNMLIEEHGTVTLSYGFHRFSRPTPLTSFKETMLFQKYSHAKGYIVNPILLQGVRLSVFILIKLLKRKSLKQKWAKETIRLYQGHRRLKEALKHPVSVPQRRTETIPVSKAA